VNATRVAAALAERAEEVCRRYLPRGRKQGRYWVAGDIHGARGRSLFVRLAPPGVPGKWTDAAEGTHVDDRLNPRLFAFLGARDFGGGVVDEFMFPMN